MSEITPEVIDINSIGDTPTITLNKDEDKDNDISVSSIDKPSVNFGGGIELLMNDKRKNDSSKNPSNDVKLDDLNDLENQLNSLTDDIESKSPKPKSKSSLFESILNPTKTNEDNGNSGLSEVKTISSSEKLDEPIIKIGKPENTIGSATASEAKQDSKNKTWDGFGKFNNIPVDPDKQISKEPKLSPEEMLREKFSVLRKLEALEQKGAKLTKRYTMDSPLAEMKGEYEMILADKAKSNSCKFQGRMLMAAVTGLEFLNNRFDPFDIKLDGWSEQINENIDDYDEIFGELHEKYQSKATMAPELKLLFQLGGSAIMVHMTNTMFKSAMPGMDDIMRQNPELMQQFTQAAVNTMGDNNPGFGGFMNDIMGSGGRSAPPPPNVMSGPPPAPMRTQQTKSQRHAPPSNRPDMNMARGGTSASSHGVNIHNNFETIGPTPVERSKRATTTKTQSGKRPEMNGPSDISDLLSGLKTKNIDIQKSSEKDSKISIQELKDMSNAKMPSRSKKRQKSERNTVSLDL